ncbi:MAG TPA: prephenate dehydrogenase [Epulopiscium sp.]|nr:prephenate dehydrogenase [Candidatus Epulonipiscium sp.]
MNIGIIGLGLLGGSLAKAFKKANAQNSYIIGSDTCLDTLQKAIKEGAIDHCSSGIDASFSTCSVIFVCTPVAHIPAVVRQLIPYISKDCIITDVGSTKYEIIQQVQEILDEKKSPAYFIGGHPMAGSEASGYSSSKAHLFQNAYYIITPAGNTPDFIAFILKKLVERIGAIPIVISPSYHDFATASISHVPHVIAAGLVHLIKDSDGEKNLLHTLAAGGFKDITRIASSNPDLWRDICFTNKVQILKMLKRYVQILEDVTCAIETDQEEWIFNYFKDAKGYRDTFTSNSPGLLPKTHILFVDIQDNPGMIARIATLLSDNGINIKNIGIVNHREFQGGVLQIIFEKKSHMIDSMQLLALHDYRTFY